MRAARPPEFINDRLLNVTLEQRNRAKAVTVLWHTPQLHSGGPLIGPWRSYPKHEQLSALMGANAPKGRR